MVGTTHSFSGSSNRSMLNILLFLIFFLLPLQGVSALTVSGVVNANGGGSGIYPGSSISFSWQPDSSSSSLGTFRFDLLQNGAHITTLKSGLTSTTGSLTVAIPSTLSTDTTYTVGTCVDTDQYIHGSSDFRVLAAPAQQTTQQYATAPQTSGPSSTPTSNPPSSLPATTSVAGISTNVAPTATGSGSSANLSSGTQPSSGGSSSFPTKTFVSSSPDNSGTPSTGAAGSASPSNQGAGKTTNTGAIAGGVVGGVVLLSLIIALVILGLRRRRRKPTEDTESVAPFHQTSTGAAASTTAKSLLMSKPALPQTVADQEGMTERSLSRTSETADSDLRERLRVLEAQQQALQNRLLQNGAMAPDYDADVSEQVPRFSTIQPTTR